MLPANTSEMCKMESKVEKELGYSVCSFMILPGIQKGSSILGINFKTYYSMLIKEFQESAKLVSLLYVTRLVAAMFPAQKRFRFKSCLVNVQSTH